MLVAWQTEAAQQAVGLFTRRGSFYTPLILHPSVQIFCVRKLGKCGIKNHFQILSWVLKRQADTNRHRRSYLANYASL